MKKSNIFITKHLLKINLYLFKILNSGAPVFMLNIEEKMQSEITAKAINKFFLRGSKV